MLVKYVGDAPPPTNPVIALDAPATLPLSSFKSPKSAVFPSVYIVKY